MIQKRLTQLHIYSQQNSVETKRATDQGGDERRYEQAGTGVDACTYFCSGFSLVEDDTFSFCSLANSFRT